MMHPASASAIEQERLLSTGSTTGSTSTTMKYDRVNSIGKVRRSTAGYTVGKGRKFELNEPPG